MGRFGNFRNRLRIKDLLVLESKKVLEERLFDLRDSVQLVYDSLEIGQNLKKFKKDPDSYFTRVMKDGRIDISETNSNIFKSGDCHKAHQVKPIEFWFGCGNNPYEETYYSVEHGVIVMSLFDSDEIPLFNENSIKNLTPLSFRKSIAHELNHWLQDVFHNNAGLKDLGNIERTPEFLHTSDHELNSYIHEISQIRKELGANAYNKLSLDEIFDEIGFRYFDISYDEQEKFIKRFIKRLDREGLLTKGMAKRKFFNKKTGKYDPWNVL